MLFGIGIYIDLIHNSKDMKNILVTGAGGFIARHLVKSLLSHKEFELVLTDKSDLLKYPESSINSPRLYNVDVRDRGRVFDIFNEEKIDTCIHLAAEVNVEDSIKYPDKTMMVNVNGTLNVLDACVQKKVDNFIFASSAAVYGHPIRLPIPEEHELNPISPYGVSKLIAEQHVSSYMRSKKIQKTISLRIFNAYGEGQVGNLSVLAKFAKKLSRGLAPVIYGDGMQIRDFVSIKDVVNAIILSIRAMDQNSERFLSNPNWVFNIGTGVGTSIRDVCEEMIRLSGLDLRPVYQRADNKADIRASCADITKANTILKFVPKSNFKKDLQNLVTSMVTTKV
jgi:UDP-glucose 4-epimerase